ncbi:MAG: YARHG domain-containing protein [Rhizobiaceae bacterium]|nr:MAG: YARHG domain-containing protein [Rhizobiaceae bacterium]CAG1012060.1 hypothetical protein RHIZO_04177 [Rhizobiaceae bacterium]
MPSTTPDRLKPLARRAGLLLAATVVAPLALTAAASAACYEDLGATGCPDQEVFPYADLRRLSCQNLWYVRNNIYNEAGLCFRTAAAQAAFDNSDCTTWDASTLPLNSNEQKNISRIRKVEKEKGCTK